MDSKMGAAANYQMSYFQPASDLIQERDSDIFVIDLAGFKKDQLKIQLTREPRILMISGARQLEDNRWIGFHKDIPVSQNCDTQKISARFEDGVLFLTMPKLVSPAEKEDSKLPTSETQKPQKQKHTEEPMDTPEKNQERASLKTLASDDQNKQNGTKNIPEKSHVEEETKSQEQAYEKTLGKDDQEKQINAKNVPDKSLEKEQTESSDVKSQEQAHEKTLGKDDQEKQIDAETVPDKSLEKEQTESSDVKSQEQAHEKTFTSDDQNKQTIAENVAEKSLEKDKTESSNVKSQEPDREKTSASEDQEKQNIAKNVPEKSLEKKETESSNADKKVKEKYAEGRYNSIDDDRNANRSLSDKGKEFSSKGTSQNMNSWANASANSYADPAYGPASMLKMARQKMNLVLFVLLAFLIALYVGNLIWYSKKAEN